MPWGNDGESVNRYFTHDLVFPRKAYSKFTHMGKVARTSGEDPRYVVYYVRTNEYGSQVPKKESDLIRNTCRRMDYYI